MSAPQCDAPKKSSAVGDDDIFGGAKDHGAGIAQGGSTLSAYFGSKEDIGAVLVYGTIDLSVRWHSPLTW